MATEKFGSKRALRFPLFKTFKQMQFSFFHFSQQGFILPGSLFSGGCQVSPDLGEVGALSSKPSQTRIELYSLAFSQFTLYPLPNVTFTDPKP